MATVDRTPTSIDLSSLLTALHVSAEDWEASPVSIQQAVLRLWIVLQQLQTEVQQLRQDYQHLQEQLGKNSQNSSKPPSTDPPKAPKYPPKERTGRAAGGQQGHGNTNRPLVPIEQLAAPPVPCRPDTCLHCGHPLTAENCRLEPERHQVINLPPIVAQVFEYQRYTACCPQCGQCTRAELPSGVPHGGYGPVVTAICCLLTGVYHLSRRAVSTLLADCFQIPISEASIQQQEQTMSAVMAKPWQEAREAVQAAPHAHLDETGWNQQHDPDPPPGSTPSLPADTAAPAPESAETAADPATPAKPKTAWLWVAVCSQAIFFVIRRSRGSQVAKEILGAFAGILTTDRWHAYNWFNTALRQLCWSHLLRDFQAFLERDALSQRIGAALLGHATLMFWLWFRVRDGTLPFADFQEAMEPIRQKMEAVLKDGADTAGGRTAKTCRWLYAHKEALWTFIRIEGVDPTNNEAEQAIRTAVIWRKLCYGTQTSAGSRYVERILTVVATSRLRQRPVLAYLTAIAEAVNAGTAVPSLLS
jgi:transposase